MEQQKPITHVMAGLIIGAVMIVFSLAIQFSGLDKISGVPLIGYCLIIAGLILFINMYGKAMKNEVTFGNLFGYGFKATGILIIIMTLFTVVFFMIFPDIKEKIFELTRQKMEERNMSDDDIEKGLSLWRRMFWVFTIGGILLVYAIIGAIGSLIGAAITKKKKINPADQLGM
ncbi:MAG: DUF4199 domain-containing protein [Bacteroidota bacterium]